MYFSHLILAICHPFLHSCDTWGIVFDTWGIVFGDQIADIWTGDRKLLNHRHALNRVKLNASSTIAHVLKPLSYAATLTGKLTKKFFSNCIPDWVKTLSG